MKTTFLTITLLLFHAVIPVERLWTPPLAVGLAALGVLLGLAAVQWALSIAPEGYEDGEGFHFKESRPRIRHSLGLNLLRPHHAG